MYSLPNLSQWSCPCRSTEQCHIRILTRTQARYRTFCHHRHSSAATVAPLESCLPTSRLLCPDLTLSSISVILSPQEHPINRTQKHKLSGIASFSFSLILQSSTGSWRVRNLLLLTAESCPMQRLLPLFRQMPLRGCLGVPRFRLSSQKAARNIHVQGPTWTQAFISPRYTPRSTCAESQDGCVFSFLRNCPPVFQCGGPLLCSQPPGTRSRASPHPCQCLVVSLCLTWATLLDLQGPVIRVRVTLP